MKRTPRRLPALARERTLTADVVVVGARCAGAATAMLLADAGHDVLVLDRAVGTGGAVPRTSRRFSRTASSRVGRVSGQEEMLGDGSPGPRSRNHPERDCRETVARWATPSFISSWSVPTLRACAPCTRRCSVGMLQPERLWLSASPCRPSTPSSRPLTMLLPLPAASTEDLGTRTTPSSTLACPT